MTNKGFHIALETKKLSRVPFKALTLKTGPREGVQPYRLYTRKDKSLGDFHLLGFYPFLLFTPIKGG